MHPASTFFSADNRSFVVMSSKRPRQRRSGTAYKCLRRDRKREEQQGATALQRLLHATEADEGLAEFVPETEPLAELNAETQAQSENKTELVEDEAEVRQEIPLDAHSEAQPDTQSEAQLEPQLQVHHQNDDPTDDEILQTDDTQPGPCSYDTDIFCDAAAWPHHVPERLKTELVMRSPLGLKNRSGPFSNNDEKRSTSGEWFFKRLENGVKLLRHWLVYSPSLDSVVVASLALAWVKL